MTMSGAGMQLKRRVLPGKTRLAAGYFGGCVRDQPNILSLGPAGGHPYTSKRLVEPPLTLYIERFDSLKSHHPGGKPPNLAPFACDGRVSRSFIAMTIDKSL